MVKLIQKMISVKFRVVAVFVLLFLFFLLAFAYLHGLIPLVVKLGGKYLIIETIFASLILILSGISIVGLSLRQDWAKWIGISVFFIQILHFPIDWVIGRGGESWRDISRWAINLGLKEFGKLSLVLKLWAFC